MPAGSRLLKVALDYDTLVLSGQNPTAAVASLQECSRYYDPAILVTLRSLIGLESQYSVKELPVKQLKPLMILAEDISASGGQLLISEGFELTDSIIQRLEHFAASERLHQPICVLTAVEP